MRLKPLFAAASIVALSACFGGGSAPSSLLTLTASQAPPLGGPRSVAPEEAVTVIEPSVPEALEVNRIPVYVTPTSIQYLEDAQWVDTPSALFRHLLSETIAARTGRVVLDPRLYTQVPGTRITGQLHMFGLDPTRMEVVALFDATLTRGTTVTSNRFEARVPVAAADTANVAPALNEAANRVAADVAAWVGR